MDQEMTGPSPLQIGLMLGLGSSMAEAAARAARAMSLVDRTCSLDAARDYHQTGCSLELIRVDAHFITNVTDSPQGEEDFIYRYWFIERIDEDRRPIEVIQLSECPACGADLTVQAIPGKER